MAPLNLPPIKKTFESLCNELEADSEALRAAFATVDDDLANSRNLRWAAKSTQATQDRHLNEYRRITYLDLKRQQRDQGFVFGDNVSEAANDHLLFPHDPVQVVESVCKYLMLAATLIRPKRADRDKISAHTILSRRMSMLYWITKGRRAPQKIDKAQYFHRTTEAMEQIASKVGFSREEKRRIYLGRQELTLLIDEDMKRTTAIEVHEQHAMAWIIGLTCGVRPGSLCKSTNQADRYLRLGDIKIARDVSESSPAGMFIATLTFRGLKQRAGAVNQSSAPKFLHVKCRSPARAEDMGLSIPHRILTLLLRRRLLQDHESVESLLDGSEPYLRFKPGCTNQPLLLASTAHGSGVTDQPMSTASVGAYLADRARWAGFREGVSFYSWRAKALTQANEASGLRTAKMLAAHETDSTTFEEYYDQGLYQYDAVGVMIEGREDSNSVRSLADMESERLHRLPLARLSYDRSVVIASFVKQQPAYLEALKRGAAPQELARLHSHLRFLALKACLHEEREIQRAKLTAEDIRKRREELKQPTALFKMIEDKIQRALTEADASALLNTMSATAEEYGEDEDEDALLNEANTFSSHDLRDLEDEQRLETRDGEPLALPDDSEETENGLDVEIDDSNTPCSGVDYAGVASAFMELILSFCADNEPQSNLTCVLCEEDPTVDEEKKKATYIKAKLHRHQASAYHFRVTQWKRGYLQSLSGHELNSSTDQTQWGKRGFLQKFNDAVDKFECPYECEKKYDHLDALVKHLQKLPPQTADPKIQQHEDQKRADGWYSLDFFGPHVKGVEQKKRKRQDTVREALWRHYDPTIQDLGPRTPGRWNTAPDQPGLVEFGRAAASEAMLSIPAFALSEDLQGASGPALHRNLQGCIVVPEQGVAGATPFTDIATQCILSHAEKQRRYLRPFHVDESVTFGRARALGYGNVDQDVSLGTTLE